MPHGIRLTKLSLYVPIVAAFVLMYYGYWKMWAVYSPAVGRDGSVHLRDLLAVAVRAAEAGGDAVREVRDSSTLNAKSKGKTREGAQELYTEGDLRSHRRMTSLFGNTFPNVKVISEEHDDAKLDTSQLWDYTIPEEIQEKIKSIETVPEQSITVWIDPLDATQEYSERLDHFVTTMVCVAVNGKPTIGVIHKPFSKFTVWAVVGQASNVKPRASYNENDPTIIVSRSHSGTVQSYTKKAFGKNTNIIPAGGAGYKVLSLLDLGKDKQPDMADIYMHVTFIKKWDICAGNAILEALGGHLTTLNGDNIDYRDSPSNEGGLIASIGVDHQKLLAKLPERESLGLKQK
ncbi:inositol monophosphatase 3-like [Protopterus annectens]|uniref:inositol monophosphatase 3-like n=1 Tax=Protopterus annectens TaxID=7888 RepID=UPI001CFA66C6|nr:inositol monophosphatase 3-like [Protopterus annectens]